MLNPRGLPFRCCVRPIVLVLAITLLMLPGLSQADDNPFKPPRATLHYARSRDYHVRHLELVVEVRPKDHSLQGTVTHYLSPLREGLVSVVLDAGSNLNILTCRIDGVDCKFTHTGDKLTITPLAPLIRAREAAVEIAYIMPGGLTEGGANGLGGFHWIDTDPQYPERVPGFWTQGETETNRNWVPCFDYPNDKCTSEIVVTVPEDWETIGNGVKGEVTRDTERHTRTFTWTMKQPHSTYLLSLLGGALDVRTAVWEGVTLYYVVPRGEANLIAPSYGNTPDMLQFFSKTFGVKYAWPKYAQSAMLDFGGGMENVSATTLGEDSLADGRSGHYPMSLLNSHELAHQWFGDFVTCKDWGDIWLNESFATYCEMIYDEHLEGKDRYDRDRDDDLHQYLNEATRYKRPVSTHLYENGDAMFDSHTYPKGGLILHMLRRELGDVNFYRGLQHYLQVNAYQPVDTHDLEKALSEEVGSNVEPFFDQWIFKPGHPVLDATWTYDATTKAVVLHVKQVHETSDGTPVYRLPLTVAFLRSSAGGSVERQKVTLEAADQQFRLPTNGMPDAVLIDPDHDLLKEVKDNHWSASALPVILRYAPCCLDREAAVGLLTQGDQGLNDANIALLTDALAAEKEAGVAATILRRLGDSKRESLRTLLRAEAAGTMLPRRAAALAALGKLPWNAEDMALLRGIATSPTEPYQAAEGAISGLAGDSLASNIEVLQGELTAPSLHHRLAIAAVDAVASANPEIAIPFLTLATGPKIATAVRVVAINLLTEVAPGNPMVETALVDLLKAQEAPDVQSAAIRALRERKEKLAIPALRALATTATKQQVRDQAKQAADALSTTTFQHT